MRVGTLICCFLLATGVLLSGVIEKPDAFEKIADNGYCPCWSSDGKHLVFGGMAPSWNIFKVNIKNKKSVQLTFNRGYHPSVSPDNEFIIYDSRGAMGTLKKIRFKDGKSETLANKTLAGNFSSWSPDGKYLIYTRDGKLWKFDLNYSIEMELYSMKTSISRPSWSPDGSKIAFDSGNPGQNGNIDIYIIDPDGSNLKQLTDHPEIDSQPHFSPDGKWIAFMSVQKGNRDIWIMKTDGSHKTRLTDDPVMDVWPRWSPDGKRIAFGSRRNTKSETETNIWVIDLEKKLGKYFFNEAGKGIDKEFRVKSGETELYIKIRGQDMNKPVLLYLHGGPGEANGPLLFQAYAGPELEKHFVVGYLHQRNTCMSPEAPVKTLTVNQYIEDVNQIVRFLKEKFRKDKIFLLGHSFGGALGYLYMLEHEDNIKKFVSAGGAFNTISLEENGYQTVMELAKKAADQDAIKRLKTLGPPPYETFMEGMVWRILAMRILGEMNESIIKNLDMSKVMSLTGIENTDPEWQNKSMVIASTMWKELGTIDLENKVQKISVPMLMITGAKDIMVPFRILEKGYKNYGGNKEYFILEKSNHMMFVDEPVLFVSKVVEFLQK